MNPCEYRTCGECGHWHREQYSRGRCQVNIPIWASQIVGGRWEIDECDRCATLCEAFYPRAKKEEM